MRGRKPTPIALKIARGNPGKRPIADVPMPESEIPDCPEHVIGEAREEWGRISKELLTMGTISRPDRAALAAYCVAFGRWSDNEKKMATEDEVLVNPKSGSLYRNPRLTIINTALKQMRDFLIEFGMTPSSRNRVKVVKKKEVSGFAAFLQNSKTK